MDSSRQHPTWLRILLNLCGPVGLAATWFGWVKPVLGIIAMAVGVLYVGWELKPKLSQWTRRRIWMSLSAFMLIGSTVGALYWFVVRHHIMVAPAPSPAVSLLRSSPVLQAGSGLRALPISIPSTKTAHILILQPTLQAQMEYFENPKDVAWLWPTKDKIIPPELVSLYQVSNHDSVRVFNIRIELPIRFEFPNREGGGLAANVTHKIAIESLEPSEKYEFYVVNQSKYTVEIPLPKVAELQIQGSTDRIKVQIVPHGLLADEGIPMVGIDELTLPIEPSFHEWQGDQILKRLRPQ